MYALLDKERMCVLYKHQDLGALMNLMHIEASEFSAVIVASRTPWDRFTDLELKTLYSNLCGQKYEGYNRDNLVHLINSYLDSLEVSKINVGEVAIQANSIGFSDDQYYRYLPGSSTPQVLNEVFKHIPLTAVQGFVPSATPTLPVKTAPVRATQAATGITTPSAPSPKGATGMVWVIADRILAEVGSADIKALRKAIVTACEAQGINPSTASVQYGKWRQTKNI